jgi:hypothetical protein
MLEVVRKKNDSKRSHVYVGNMSGILVTSQNEVNVTFFGLAVGTEETRNRDRTFVS